MKETKFKDTEVGRIPVDWGIIKFNSAFTFYPTNTLSRDMLCEKGDIYDIHYGDVLIKYGAVLDAEREYIPAIKKEADSFKLTYTVKNGDVIIADTAEDETVGKACEVQNVESKKIVSGLHTMWVRPIEKTFSASYLGYAMNGTIYHNQLIPFIQGTKVSSISKSAIENTYILLPPISEQHRIASALTDIDELISSLDKLITKKKDIKQGAMQQLLTEKIRLKGFTEPWVEKKLGEVGILAMCKRVFQYETADNGDVPFYKIGTFGQHADAFISFEKYNTFKRMYRFPQKGDILISAAGTIGRTVVYDGKPAYFQDSNIIWLAHDENCIINIFLYYIYKTIEWNTENTTIARLYNNNFNNTKISFPSSLAEQRAIATILTDMDNELAALEAKRNKYAMIKDGMMQQLLTGKIRLTD